MIRNADEIWFQTNALSHKLYDAVTDCAAGHAIPIRYFRYASATKCAEQLIQAQRTKNNQPDPKAGPAAFMYEIQRSGTPLECRFIITFVSIHKLSRYEWDNPRQWRGGRN